MTIYLPEPLLLGYWAVAYTPWLMLVSSKHKDNAALIAHERCHQEQQRRDGTLRFWWRYLTNKQARFDYELEAYRVWCAVAPQDQDYCARVLAGKYGLGLTAMQALVALSERLNA